MIRSSAFKYGVLVTLSLSLLVACATSPLGRRQLKLFSDQEIAQMGVQSYQELKSETPVTKDASVNRYVQCVAQAITRQVAGNTVWEVNVFAEDQANAFALPGGKIGVYTGLLDVAKNQDQLAAVIGHEVGHVIAGHSNERVSSQAVAQLGGQLTYAATGIDPQLLDVAAQTFFLLPYSRAHESEADLIGEDLMADAGFDPRESIQLWINMGQLNNGERPPQFLSTHPSPENRIRDLNNRLEHSMAIYTQARAAGRRPNCK